MKILDRYLLKSFTMTLASVFVILFFIFILQTLWLFITELAGKDLDIFLVLKFLLFAMPRIIPLVLPLSVLLASIMTFGSLAENYEFAAMKSSGISLLRAMRSQMIFIVLLSMGAFVFANNVIPYAEYKFINFRKDIAQMKPAMAIAAGQFNDVGIYNIKVDKKSGKDGNFLTGITIHKKNTAFDGTKNVIKARDGELVGNQQSNILQLVLNDGYYYEDLTPKKFEEKQKLPFAKSTFKKYVINIDLSKFNKSAEANYEISNTNTMMNASELRYTLDSLNKSYRKDISSFADNTYQRTGITSIVPIIKPEASAQPLPDDLLSGYNASERKEILKNASASLQGIKYSIESSKVEFDNKIKNINTHWLSLFDKFVVAYSCLLMFFIGAPLGAIIRKGGLGLPIVFAILIFITYNFANTFGRKIASENGLTPFVGSWLSSFILTPFALLLTYRAVNDMSFVFNVDPILLPLQRIFSGNQKTGRDDLAIETDAIVSLRSSYKLFSGLALAAFFVLLISIPLSTLLVKIRVAFIIISVVMAVIFYVSAFRAQKKVADIGKIMGEKLGEPAGIAAALGIPFYLFIYFFNNAALDGALKDYEPIVINSLRAESGDGKPFELRPEAVLPNLERSYRQLSKIAVAALFLILTLVPTAILIAKLRLPAIIISTIIAVIFYISAFRAQRKLEAIGNIFQKTLGEPAWIVATLGIPFYIFSYFLNGAALKRAMYNFRK